MYRRAVEKNDGSFGEDKIISVANMHFKPVRENLSKGYLQTYNVMLPGDIAFEGHRSKHFAYGRFVENTIGPGIVSHVFEVFRPTSPYEITYWKYAINNEYVMRKILARATKASTMMHSLVAKDFLAEAVCVPSLREQARIGEFFARLDSLITLHQRKLEHLREMKRGLLQKMFPKDGESAPELRFPGFTDPWEQRKLGEVTRRVTRKNKNNISKLPLTISAQYGLVDQESFFKKRVASRDMSGYYLMKKGEFAYNKSTSSDSPWGAIKRLERYEKGCVSTLYIVFSATSVDPQFLATYYDSDHWFKGVRAIAAEGARNHGLLNIAPSDFFNTTIRIACSEMEQQAIGAFFKSVDSLITLHQRKELASVVNCLQIGDGPINPNRTVP